MHRRDNSRADDTMMSSRARVLVRFPRGDKSHRGGGPKNDEKFFGNDNESGPAKTGTTTLRIINSSYY